MSHTNPLAYAIQWIAAGVLAAVVINIIHSATTAQIERMAATIGGLS